MAEIVYTEIDLLQGNERLFRWTGITEADTGKPVVLPGKADVTVQVTLISGTTPRCDIEGTLRDTDASFQQLHDPQGGDLQFTAVAIESVLENVTRIRPNVNAGTGVLCDVYMLFVGQGG